MANYYGVGAYLRPLEDVRRAEVRFAAECLAFANVPDDDALARLDGAAPAAVGGPRWKAGVPRDAGAGWDFEDVRDHYLRLLFGADPAELRGVDPERYVELSRAVSGEVMAEVFGEWRRDASPCGGGLVLWLKDLAPGAGWGVLDDAGAPKLAFGHLARALAPIAVWSTDEGLNGIDVHIANDRPEPLEATLRVALYRDFELPVAEASHPVLMSPHSGYTGNLELLLGRFVDVNWAYRFGSPAQDLIVMSVELDGGASPPLLSQAFRMPLGRPAGREPAARLAVTAAIDDVTEAAATVTVAARRFVSGVRLRVPGFAPDEDGFSVEPGHRRTVSLRASASDPARAPAPAGGSLTALNLEGRVPITPAEGR